MYYVYIDRLEILKNEKELIQLVNSHYRTQCTDLYQLQNLKNSLKNVHSFVYESSLKRFFSFFWGELGSIIGKQSNSSQALEEKLKQLFELMTANNRNIDWESWFGLKFVAYRTLAYKLEDSLSKRER